MEKEELEKYKIRDYYMIPVEVVDNMFYLFEQQCKKQKEVLDKGIKYVEDYTSGERIITYEQYKSELLNILKEVSDLHK